MSCNAGVCTPTDKNANLNATDLATMLAASDVKIVTGAGSYSIEISAPLTWAGDGRLTLDANQSIRFRAQVEVEGMGAVTLITNDGGTGGQLQFLGGNLAFWDHGRNLTINGRTYKLIGTLSELKKHAAVHPGRAYALANSYDASVDGTYAHSPVPTTFNGFFEGLGNPISNLAINDTTGGENAGLFASVGASGVIHGVVLVGASVHGAGPGAGGIVASNQGLITNASISGAVGGGANTSTGGIAGQNDGTILSSVSSAHTFGGSGAGNGGLAGSNAGTIQYSSASGSGSGGGLVGNNLSSGLIEDSHATGSMSTSSGSIGGLASTNAGTVLRSYATGSLSAIFGQHTSVSGLLGGLVGYNTGTIAQSFATGDASTNQDNDAEIFGGGLVALNQGTVTNSYATGSVTCIDPEFGYSECGGLIGENDGTASASYSTGHASGAFSTGGFIGENEVKDSLSDCYWDITTSQTSQGVGRGDSAGVTGLTTTQFQAGLPGGFDSAIWAENTGINGGLPYLLALPPKQ